MSRFQVGDRVVYSPEAAKLHPRLPRTRQGTVRIVQRTDLVETVYVRWAGRSSDEALHHSYLDLVERPQGGTR